MPYFDPDPIDPDLDLSGGLGPGRENRPDDRAKLASAIEKRTGAAPHAELGRFGDALAQHFAGSHSRRKNGDLSPGFLGAIGAAQVRRGTDPDTVVLKDGPTRDALRGTGQGNEWGGFVPLPKLKRSVGPPLSNRAPNRPEDARALQGKLASLGYAPRVAEKPLFPHDAGKQPLAPPFYPPRDGAGRQASSDLQALLDGVRLFQRREGLKPDALVNPGGPTERALDARNERARAARRDRLEEVSRGIMESDAPEYAPITDRAAADALAGLIVANEVQDRRKARLAEPKPLSFRPERLPGGARPASGKAGGVLAQRRTGGGGSRSGNSDPVTHGNRLRDRIREKRAQRERERKKKADAETLPEKQTQSGTNTRTENYLNHIKDKKVRESIDGILKDSRIHPENNKKSRTQIYQKNGGIHKAIRDYFQAVRDAGGKAWAVQKGSDGRLRFTASDGTEIMYRRILERQSRTNEIHILRPSPQKKAIIKIRYPE